MHGMPHFPNVGNWWHIVQGHEFHPDSQEKEEFIVELSFGNGGPSSQANLYKSMPRSAFKSMPLWMKEYAWEPLAISRPSLRGPQPKDVDAFACAKEL